MLTISRFINITIFFLLLNAYEAHAAIYYVSSNASNSWAQAVNKDTPCKPSVALANAKAGDVVYFRAGVYSPANDPYPLNNTEWSVPHWNPANSGNSTDGPITFAACHGERVQLIASSEHYLIGASGRNYIIWDGFEGVYTTEDAGHGVIFFETQNCTLRNCRLYGRDRGSSFYDNNPIVRGQASSNLTIQNNHLERSKGASSNSCGIQFYSVDHATIERNTIKDANAGINDKDGGVSNIYRYNILNANVLGFLLGAESNGVTSDNIFLYNNIFSQNTTQAIFLNQPQKPGGDVYIYNNTISQSANYGIGVYGNIDHIFNNIIITGYQNYSNRKSGDYGGKPYYCDYNLYYGSPKWVIMLYDATEATFTSLSAWSSSNSLASGEHPDVNSFYESAYLGDNYEPTEASPNGVKAGGIGGIYPTYIGAVAWPIDTTQQIGYRQVLNGTTVVTASGNQIFGSTGLSRLQ